MPDVTPGGLREVSSETLAIGAGDTLHGLNCLIEWRTNARRALDAAATRIEVLERQIRAAQALAEAVRDCGAVGFYPKAVAAIRVWDDAQEEVPNHA